MAKSIAFSFGRFNPPTIGHLKLMDATKGANRNYRIYVSRSQDPKKNPLKHKDKLAVMKGMFPQHAKKIRRDSVPHLMEVLVRLYKEKHTDVVMVVGSDRIKEMNRAIMPYNGKKATHGFYKFKTLRIVSAGQRDPDGEGVSGMSASKMRAAATKNDYKSFEKGLPPKFRGGKKLFKVLQKEMGVKRLREWTEMKEVRVKFLKKKLTNKGKTTPADQLIPHDRAPRIEGFREMVARKNL